MNISQVFSNGKGFSSGSPIPRRRRYGLINLSHSGGACDFRALPSVCGPDFTEGWERNLFKKTYPRFLHVVHGSSPFQKTRQNFSRVSVRRMKKISFNKKAPTHFRSRGAGASPLFNKKIFIAAAGGDTLSANLCGGAYVLKKSPAIAALPTQKIPPASPGAFNMCLQRLYVPGQFVYFFVGRSPTCAKAHDGAAFNRPVPYTQIVFLFQMRQLVFCEQGKLLVGVG